MKTSFRTITELEKELESYRKRVAKGQLLNGDFGLIECKESIKFHCYISHTTYSDYYAELVVRGLTERLFNTMMIIACEQLMKGDK